jgi:PKD repeat protein
MLPRRITDDAQVTEWSWDFDGDGTPDATTANASFTYTTAAAFDVRLTVRDAQGLSDTKTSTITIAPPVNPPPMAGFTYTCNAADCSFTSTSTDVAPGTISTYAWTFGDGGTADVNNPSHSYTVSAPTDFTVTLTVTDNEGATDVETQTVTVTVQVNTPPTASFTPWCYGENCIFRSTSTDVAPGTIATYAWTFGDGATEDWNAPSHVYTISARTTFTVTLTVTDNEGATAVATQRVTLSPLPPAVRRARIFGGRLDELCVYQAGTQARIWFTQGVSTDPLDPPAGHLVGTFPDWTLNFEDGDHPSAPGEPDFTDVVVGVHATVR